MGYAVLTSDLREIREFCRINGLDFFSDVKSIIPENAEDGVIFKVVLRGKEMDFEIVTDDYYRYSVEDEGDDHAYDLELPSGNWARYKW